MMQVGQNLQSKAGDIKDKVRLKFVEEAQGATWKPASVPEAQRLAMSCGTCVEAFAVLPCCAVHALCVVDACQLGRVGLFAAQAAQFPGASTAEGKGNAAGGPSEVRLC